MPWDVPRWAVFIYGVYTLVENRVIVRDNVEKLLRTVHRSVCPPKESKQNRLIVPTVRICGAVCITWLIYIVCKRIRIPFTTKPSDVVLAVLFSYGYWTTTQEESDYRKTRPAETKPPGRTIEPKVIIDGLCVVAADQHTLSTIAEQVREATGSYKVEEHLVINRKAVAELPIYTGAICCVRNAERNISFNKMGVPEPDADLGFRAFDKMEPSTGKRSGVLLLLFDHAESQGISELYNMEGLTPSPRLLHTAQDSRFLTVYRQLNGEQKDLIKSLKRS